jgi:hypothetical protein
MTVESLEIPQADVLWHVARVPEAIARGATTAEAVGVYLGAKVRRQGRYYTQAARILGLVNDDQDDGTVALSAYGKAFVRYDLPSQERALRHRMMVCEPMRSVIVALMTSGGMDVDGVANVLLRLAPISISTAQRRARTIVAWLRDLGMVQTRKRKLVYTGLKIPGVEMAPLPAHTLTDAEQPRLL